LALFSIFRRGEAGLFLPRDEPSHAPLRGPKGDLRQMAAFGLYRGINFLLQTFVGMSPLLIINLAFSYIRIPHYSTQNIIYDRYCGVQ
jgi:hypothetical protein